MKKLKPKVKKRWLSALTSGNYRKAKDSLKHHGRFCCLGVLCDLFDPSGWDAETPYLTPFTNKLYQGQDTTPPPDVIEWSGLSEIAIDRLMRANDETAGWDKVIKIIEE